jgi:hypothetical protein
MSQRSPDNMTIMRMQKVLTAARRKLDLSEKALLEMEIVPKAKVNGAPSHPKEEQVDAFARVLSVRPVVEYRQATTGSSLRRRNLICCFPHSDNVKPGV